MPKMMGLGKGGSNLNTAIFWYQFGKFLGVYQVEDVKKFLADPDAYAAANPVAAAPAAGGAAEAKKEEKKAQKNGGKNLWRIFAKSQG